MQETRVRKKSGFLFDYVAKPRYRIPAANSYIGSAYVRVSRCSFQVSRQDPGQGFKLQFPSFKFQTKIQVRVSSCNSQVASWSDCWGISDFESFPWTLGGHATIGKKEVDLIMRASYLILLELVGLFV